MTLAQIFGLFLSVAAFVGLIWYRTVQDRRDEQRAPRNERLAGAARPESPRAGR